MRTARRTLCLGLLAAIGVWNAGKASAGDYGWLELSNGSGSPGVVTPHVNLYLYPGTSNGYEPGTDTPYPSLSGQRIDFYSQIPGYNLTDDVRPPEGTLPFSLQWQASGLTGPVTSDFTFNMIDSTYWTGKPLVADITKNSTPFLTNIDVWDYSANHTPISLSFNPGDSYSMTISSVPEPGTIAMLSGLGLVGAAAYFVRRKRQKQQA